jgi:hypothetical protein
MNREEEEFARFGAVDRGAIARELAEADRKRTNADLWVIELSFWVVFILFLALVWGLIAGFNIWPVQGEFG